MKIVDLNKICVGLKLVIIVKIQCNYKSVIPKGQHSAKINILEVTNSKLQYMRNASPVGDVTRLCKFEKVYIHTHER